MGKALRDTVDLYEKKNKSKRKYISNQIEMLNFWENISRYPRFFISVILGFVTLLIYPFKNLLRIEFGWVVILIGSTLSISCIIIILENMLNL